MTQKILDFLAERKQKWLDAKLKKETDEAQQQLIKVSATEKFAPAIWITDAAKRVTQLSMVSHPGKFSHPSAKISSLVAQATSNNDGYLRSGNMTYPLDVLGNAAAMDVYKFLSIPLSDEETVLAHFESETPLIQNFISALHLDFKDIRQDFLSIKADAAKPRTDALIKQVYFPLDDGSYHLLSILTPSGMVTELKQRIDHMRFSDESKKARQCKKDQQWHNGFQDLPNLTITAYGGTKPQNISVLNNQNAGRAYLLPCIPPELNKQPIRLPTKDFFDQCLFIENEPFKILFSILKKLIDIKPNNMETREDINDALDEIIEEILRQADRIKEQTPGWSKDPRYHRLPESQRIWLDLHPDQQQQRQNNSEWYDDIQECISDWIADHLSKQAGKRIQLQDVDYRHIFRKAHDLLKEQLEHDKEFL
ncbi:type I-F CRISPR-associated protein Csy1 [Neisseriaceae bacterium ESL0693]|nr:type I-F CRISPR-associated protein Csy1 [Neisseriaceae bacterium ESL0693]